MRTPAQILDRLSLQVRVWLVIVLVIAGLAALTVVSAVETRKQQMATLTTDLANHVASAVAIADSFEQRAKAGEFDPAQAAGGPSVTVVLERAGQRLAMLADAVAEVVDLGLPDDPATASDEPDVRAELAWLKGAAAGERMVLVLDPDQLILPADRSVVHTAMAATTTAQAA